MSFPTRLLNEGEEVVLDLHPHWWYLSGPVVTVLVAVGASLAGYAAGIPTALQLVLVAAVLISLVWLLIRYARWHTTSFVLTNDRLVRRSGVIAKRGREIPLDHINDISYNQTIFDRVIGAGDVSIESAGRRGQEVFPDLPKPGLIQNEIYRLIEQGKLRQTDRTAGRQELSIPEQIEKLDELRRRGALTQAEFEATKAELLDKL
jgi:uncharacterized membrane protein YdbT with pleckstrin-like domain